MKSNMDISETSHDEALTEELFRHIYKYHKPKDPSPLKKMTQSMKCSGSTAGNVFPILQWLPKYSLKRDFVSDIIAGLTVAVMHIPHGLAYAPLAGQTPVVGLYMAVFPTLLYVLFGTSRHISLGTFAIVCMMVGEAVYRYATYFTTLVDADVRLPPNGTLDGEYSNVEVVITITFLVGALQLVMGALHLGSLWLLLSNSLVSGFTTGAAVHVATFQIKNLLGVSGGGFKGAFKWELTVLHLFKQVQYSNWITFGVSVCSITLLAVFNDQVKPLIHKKLPQLKVPIPMELIVIILGILTSYFLDLSDLYGVNIVRTIPTGLPEPMVPRFELIPRMAGDCFVIAVVAISINLSLASIFAKKGGYVIRQNQELVAYGVANIFASFFLCPPSAASLSRSLVQSAVGGKSLIASVVTVAAIVLMLLFLGPLFEPVPYCVLSSIVVVTLKGLLWQMKDFPGIWRQSKMDGAVWLVTFLSVVLVDLDIGLWAGLAMSVISLVMSNQNPSVVEVGRIAGTNIFMDATLYPNVEKIPNILMLQATGALTFANFAHFHDKFLKLSTEFLRANMLVENKELSVVLELSGVPSLDPTSANGIADLYKDLKIDKCQLFITDANADLYDFLDHSTFFISFPKSNVIFSLFDAVEYLMNKPPSN